MQKYGLQAWVFLASQLLQLSDGTLCKEFSLLDDADAIAKFFCNFKGMGGHEHGETAPFQSREDSLNEPSPFGIQAHKRFIHNENPWFMQQGSTHD